MFAIFQRKLFKNWLMILGWGIGLALLGYLLFDMYETFFIEDVAIAQIMDAFPEQAMAFFGGDVDLSTPEGFLHIEFFSYMPVILGFLVISSAASLITKQEEEGTLEIVVAQPISRSAVFWSRLLALLMSVILLLVVAWGGFAMGLARTASFDLQQADLILPFVSLFAVLFAFLALALLLSMIFSSKVAVFATGFLLIASWFITSLALIDDRLEVFNRFSLLNYYQGGGAMGGLDGQSMLIMFGSGILFILLAWFLFLKRDLRFGGSGGLHLALPRKVSEGE